jgi:hypothetical protein
LLRALETADHKRATGLTINAAVRPERSTWIRHRLHVYYGTDDDLREAPRQELAALAVVAGWWPPKATGRPVRTAGMTPEHALALEADLMDRARKRLLKQHAEIEADPLIADLAAALATRRNLPP